MATKPAIVFATGSFSSPDFYTNLKDALLAKGYEISIPHMRTVSKKPGDLPTMYDDAALYASEIEKFADQGKDVILIAHSYGGTPSTESVKGVSKSQREKDGKKGGLVRLGYISSVVPIVGMAAGGTMVGIDGMVGPDEDGWLWHLDTTFTAKIVFSHLPLEEGIELAKAMPQHSSVSFGNELTYAGYKDVPSSWLFCEEDECVTPEAQQKGIERIEEATGKKVDVTRKPYDHCPTVSNLDGTVAWIEDVAAKGGQWE